MKLKVDERVFNSDTNELSYDIHYDDKYFGMIFGYNSEELDYRYIIYDKDGLIIAIFSKEI